jgi:3'-5' exoribonuclease
MPDLQNDRSMSAQFDRQSHSRLATTKHFLRAHIDPGAQVAGFGSAQWRRMLAIPGLCGPRLIACDTWASARPVIYSAVVVCGFGSAKMGSRQARQRTAPRREQFHFAAKTSQNWGSPRRSQIASRLMSNVALSEMIHGQEADVFVLMTAKEELTTRDGKPYYKVGFRDHAREVTFPIWHDSPWGADCREAWQPGTFYKVRAVYRDTNYGPQLELRKIREVCAADRSDGFTPAMCLPQTRFDVEAMFAELLAIARQRIDDAPLAELVVDLLGQNREALLSLPAATHNHHAFVGGWLEHVLSVTRTCVYLADKYDEYYPQMEPRLNKGLVVAGAILHDIGKLREIEAQPQGAVYTAAGNLIGHILQGRDIVREAAVGRPIDAELLLRLEHIIVSHQRLPEWGSPKPPMTPEALLVHYADDMDAKYQMMVAILRDDTNPGPVTSKKNVLYQKVFRGMD